MQTPSASASSLILDRGARGRARWFVAALAFVATALVVLVGLGSPRAAVADSNPQNSTVKSAQVFYTYVEAGEQFVANFTKRGNTYSGTGDPVLSMTAPDGTVTTCSAITGDSPKGTACLFDETASTSGVYAVTIRSSDPASTVPQTKVTMNWDIHVDGASGTVTGRTWTESFVMRDELPLPATSASEVPLLRTWFLSHQGYQYQVEHQGINGIDSAYFANALGIVDTDTCTSAYQSIGVLPSPAPAVANVTKSSCAYEPYKLFFGEPAQDLPSSVTLPDVNRTTWLLSEPKVPSIEALAFAPSAAGARDGSVTLRVRDFEGNAKLQVDVDGDGVFDGPSDRLIPAVLTESGPTVVAFDGKDAAGMAIATTTPIAFRLMIDRVAEIHVIQGDIELSRGISVRRLNGPAGNETRVYWNDEPLLDPLYNAQAEIMCSRTPVLASGPDGVDSSSFVHGWDSGTCGMNVNSEPSSTVNGGTWGNNRMIDTWAHADAEIFATADVPGYTVQKTSNPGNGEEVVAGQPIDYTVTASVVRYPHADQITPAFAADHWSATISDDFSGVADDAAVDAGSATLSPASGDFTVEDTHWTWAEDSIPLDAPAVVDYRATVNAEISGDALLKNVAYPGVVPPTSCDPGMCASTENPVIDAPVVPDGSRDDGAADDEATIVDPNAGSAEHVYSPATPKPSANGSLALTGADSSVGLVVGGLLLLGAAAIFGMRGYRKLRSDARRGQATDE